MSTRIQHKRGTAAAWAGLNPVLALAEIGYERDTGQFKIGDGETVWNDLPYSVPAVVDGGLLVADPEPEPEPFATLVSTKSSGNVSGTASSTTGYIKVEWWDNTTNVYGAGGSPTTEYSFSKAATAGEKTIRVYPSDAGGALSGTLSRLSCASNSLTSLNVSGLTSLIYLNCEGNLLASLNVSGLTALRALFCSNNSLASLNAGGLTALDILVCASNSMSSLNISGTAMFALNVEDNSFTSLDLSGVPTLEQLFCADNLLTSLNLSGLTELTYVECHNNSLTSLDVSGNEGIQELNCRNNDLTSLRAIGAVIGGYYSSTSSYGEGCDCRDNNLSATALDQFYSDLAPAVGAGILRVASNPGTSADDPTIATAKGYIVFGS